MSNANRKKYLSEILENFENGDHVSDQELHDLHEAVSQMAKVATDLGPSFHLAFIYASYLERSTRAMIDARKGTRRE